MIKIHLILISITLTSIQAKDIHVSPHNVQNLLRKAVAGDTFLLSEGRYSTPISIQGLIGTADKPITISAKPGAQVIFDGTDQLSGEWQEVLADSPQGKLIQAEQWKRMRGKLYSMSLADPIDALIYNGQLMSDARWPNSRWSDPWRLDRYMVLRRASEQSVKGKLHDGLPTENTLEESSKWLHYDRSKLQHREESLAETGISFENGVVLMSHTWGSWATRITGHTAGSNSFNYDTEFSGSGKIQQEAKGFLNNRIGWDKAAKRFKISTHGGIHFFFMGLAALDIQQEWWYDEPSKTLYFIAPDGKKPAAGVARGKRRDYLISARNCQHLQIKNIQFHGAGALLKNCSSSRLEDCQFVYSSYHKFSTGNFDMPVTTKIENPRTKENFENALVNCEFRYLDGNAFEGRSQGLTIDNILIHQTQQTTLGLDSRSMSITRPSLVRRVSISDVGASVGIKGGGIDSIYELNNISRFGGLQYDGASLQMGGRHKVIYRYNWSHDHPKRSYRFDSGSFDDAANAYGEMSYNVAWNTPGGFSVKGDDHLIHNNLLLGSGGFELFNMKRWASKNERTVVANNITSRMSAGHNDWKMPVVKKSTTSNKLEKRDDYWLKETIVAADHPTGVGKDGMHFDDGTTKGRHPSPLLAIRKNNFYDDPNQALRDPQNLDFRPKLKSELIDAGYPLTHQDVTWKSVAITGVENIKGKAPDIGAYEKNDKHYWIPGFKYPHASTPVPPDNSTTAQPDCSLMWLAGYKAETHHLFISSDKQALEKATIDSQEYCGVFHGSNNIYNFESTLPAGSLIYWRVDSERNGKTVQGSTWQFKVKDTSGN